jgi:hypothetical protein
MLGLSHSACSIIGSLAPLIFVRTACLRCSCDLADALVGVASSDGSDAVGWLRASESARDEFRLASIRRLAAD